MKTIDTMAVARPTVGIEEIQEVVRQIAQRFHPQKVILFGSYAYGTPTEDSDVDFLVVASDPPSRSEVWGVVNELRRPGNLTPQIFFMNPEEFDETKDVVGGLAYPAHHWGRVLYEENS